MDILVLAPQAFFQHRGTPIATRRVLEVLSAEGHRIDVLTYHEGEDVDIPNCTIHRIPTLPGVSNVRPGPSLKKILCDVVMLAKCLRMLRKRRWQVIHAIEEGVFMALLIRAIYGIPFVYDMDSSLSLQIAEKYPILTPFTRLIRLAERPAVAKSVGVVAVCKALEEEARALCADANVLRIEDVSLLNPDAEGAEDLRARLGIAGALILYVGNLEAYQGIDLMLQAFASAAPHMPAAHLVVIGGSPRDVQSYRDRALGLGLSSRAHFVGPRPLDGLGSYLRHADVLVSPRVRGNNTPMKIYSYLDSGKPILATRLSTHTQVLDDSVALLVEPDSSPMAEGMGALVSQPALGARLAAAAQERVRTTYDPKLLDAKLANFYADLSGALTIHNGPPEGSTSGLAERSG